MSAHTQRGAAVVVAMLVVAATAALVAGVFWQQNLLARQAENELSYAQAKWLLRGAIDWTRIILREDMRTSSVDHAGEPWALPLAETRLNDGDGRDPVYLAGRIRDEQAKFNLRNLVGPGGPIERETEAFRRLLALLNVNEALLGAVVQRMTETPGLGAVDDLLALRGVDAALVERLRPFVTVLPQATPVNANTASAEVLAARIENLDLADARRLVESRDRAHFRDVADVVGRLGELRLAAGEGELAVSTRFFVVEGEVSYRRARLHGRALVRRSPNSVEALWLREAS
jgi:general secretion pathway protein K